MTSYRNPVVRGNAPDPSIVRVGDDFYLATSTFDHLPGILIRHSTNLVDWTLLGGAVTRPAQYRRDGQPGDIMLYAPTLRYAEGTFHLVCTNVVEGQGNFIISAEDPAGPWSDALWLDTDAFDPSLLFDDGTWYYTRRTLDPRPDGTLGPVVQAELDMRTGELGALRELTADRSGFCSNDIEGPHLYRIGDWYYLFSAEGSTWKGHMQTCGRSRSPWGPFEPAPHNPVLTHRHRVGHPIQTLGHSDLVEAADGSWWAVALGTRHESHGGFVYHHNLGRETFLLPVEWVDGWPVIGTDGTTELVVDVDRPLPTGGSPRTVEPSLWTDGWVTLGPPRPGTVRLDADAVTVERGLDLDVPVATGALLRSQKEDAATFSARIDEIPHAPDAAGIAAYSDARHHYSLLLSRLPDGSVEARFRRVVDDLTTETVHSVGEDAGTVTITADASTYAFAIDGIEAGSGSARLLSAEAAEAFVGAQFALLALGEGTTEFREIRF